MATTDTSLAEKPKLANPVEESAAADQLRQKRWGADGEGWREVEQERLKREWKKKEDENWRSQLRANAERNGFKEDTQKKPSQSESGSNTANRGAMKRSGKHKILPTTDLAAAPEKSDASISSPGSRAGNLFRQAKNLKKQQEFLAHPIAASKEMAIDIAAAPISMATSELLQQSWMNLINSYGLTIFYINFHVFARWTIGEKFFCKLGHEWLGAKSGAKLGA